MGSLSRINYHLNYTPISYVVILFTYICYHTRDIAAGAHCHNGMVTHIFVYPGYVNTNYRTSAARAHRLDILSHAFKVQINMCHPYNNNKSFEVCLHKVLFMIPVHCNKKRHSMWFIKYLFSMRAKTFVKAMLWLCIVMCSTLR